MVEFPDLNTMSADELRVYLEATDFSKQQIDQVINAANHNDLFVKVVHWRNIARAGGEVYEARLALRKRQIFIPDDIRGEFSAVSRVRARGAGAKQTCASTPAHSKE